LLTNDDSLRESAAKLGLAIDRFNRDFLDRRYSSRTRIYKLPIAVELQVKEIK